MAEKVITLPSTEHLPEPIWVKIKSDMPIGKMLSFTYEEAKSIPDIIAEGIESWNLDDGVAPLPISGTVLRRLRPSDVWAIGNAQYERKSEPELEKEVIRYLGSKGTSNAPWWFIAYRYRCHFHISWREFEATPFEIVWRDIMLMNIEAQYQNTQAERNS